MVSSVLTKVIPLVSVIGEMVEIETRIDGLGSINALINLFFKIFYI